MTRRAVAVAIELLVGCMSVASATTVTATITGSEQYAPSSGNFDQGDFTVMVNGYAKTVHYGQFSSGASIASAVAAKFSLDCNSPVVAHAQGGTVTFQSRNTAASLALTATVVWNQAEFGGASFAINTQPGSAPPGLTPGSSPLLACTPFTLQAGQNLTCSVGLTPGAQAAANFSLDGATWTPVLPDPASGVTTINQIMPTPGTVTVAYSYPGETLPSGVAVPASSGTTRVTVNAANSPVASGPSLYHFSITDANDNSGYALNGNILAYTDSVNGTWRLGYDGLNRLSSSQQATVNGTSLYGCWQYDSFGNMLTQALSTQGITQSGASCQPQPGATNYVSSYSYSAANRIVSGKWLDGSNNTHTGSPAYDDAGNMTNDLQHAYLYDADGHVCAVQTGPNAYEGYLYDAEGHRVAKGIVPSLTCDPNLLQVTSTYFIGPDGETMTEMDGQGNWVRTEVSAAGQWLATYKPDGIHYPVTDWLDTKRLTVNPNLAYNNGVEQKCSSYPFGDWLKCDTAPGGTSPREFTGKERDQESGLDYFGARYYASSMGRWTSPDPSGLALADLGNPQSLNLYSYVINNPMILVDPDGLCYGQVKSSVWTCIGAFFHNLFGGGSDENSSSSSSSSTINESVTVTMHWPALMQPGINYGNPNGPKGNNVGGCPLGTCHNFDGMYRPLTRGTFDGGMFIMGILDGGFGASPSMFGKPSAGSTYEEGVAAAQARYPAKAGRIEKHHIAPMYLGGDPLGIKVPLDGAYHQMITNEFRNAVPYGTGPIPPDQLNQLMQKFMKRFRFHRGQTHERSNVNEHHY